MTPARRFFEEHMRYITAQDIEKMVNETYADDAVLYHNFPYFEGSPPFLHRGKREIIDAHRTIFAPQNHGAIEPVGEVFNFIEGVGDTNSLLFQILIKSPTKGLFLNSDFWIFGDGKMKHQFVTGYSLKSA
jgi:hypothetical protein